MIAMINNNINLSYNLRKKYIFYSNSNNII